VIRLVVALLVAIVAVGVPPAGAAERPSPADLEAQLVCPTCHTTLDQSDSPVARRMKAFIRARIAAGASAAQIKRELVDQFGPGVLATPRKEGFDLLAWVLPLGVLAGGLVAVGLLAWAWSRRRDGEPAATSPPLDPVLERRVDEELARFDE
jgi:cytochrome c-type biogenesis protein CcmH